MHERVLSAIFAATERTIHSLSNRVMQCKEQGEETHDTTEDCLFSCEYELYNNKLRIMPSTDEIKIAMEDIIKIVLNIPKHIPLWNAKGHFYDSIL